MKSLKFHFESLLDDDDIFLDHENDKKVIEEWILNNYDITGKLTISDDFVVDCDKYVYVENKNITSLTNGIFRWGKVRGHFYCNHCENLITLEGSTKEVGGNFDCSDCVKLKTLEGSPEYVDGTFSCDGCRSLKSLEGTPKEVGGYFNCSKCINLKSLEGAPEKIGGCLNCRYCDSLKITNSDRKKYILIN